METNTLITDSYAIIKKNPEDSENITLQISFLNYDNSEHFGNFQISIKDSDNRLFFQNENQLKILLECKNILEYKFILEKDKIYEIRYSLHDVLNKFEINRKIKWETKPVNFFYTFSTPHRITVALPDSSNKTLVDVEPSCVYLSWTYSNLMYEPYDSFRAPQTDWRIILRPLINNELFKESKWERSEGYLPVLRNSFSTDDVFLILEILGSQTAAIVKIELKNASPNNQKINLNCLCPGNWKGYNPGWIDENVDADNLLAGWGAPADRILIFTMNADTIKADTANSIDLSWEIKSNETKIAWLIRPYNAFASEFSVLRAINWENEFNRSKNIWKSLLINALKIIVPDESINNAFLSCFADLFIMREPIGKGYITSIPGTEMYRSAPNSIEPALVTVALDQFGFHKEAEDGYKVNWELQTGDGDWSEPGGWSHLMWGVSGFKAWAILEHYLLSGDIKFLENHYNQLISCSRWQHKQREKTKIIIDGKKSIYYGLMPKGMGDGGLLDGNDFYGIFYTHNIWAVYADFLSYSAAILLNKNEDFLELKTIYEEAKINLLNAMEYGAIIEPDGSRWLSGVPGKKTGSCWGVLNAAFPTNILEPYHELITGTLKHVEAEMSDGGLPIHTGWMKNGMWVAIALDNFAEVHLLRGERNIANALFYSTLNHATPLYSWCEERGQEPFSNETLGDRQHLWTPVAVVRYIRDMFIMEQNNILFLARGIPESWITSGKKVGIKDAPTHFGKISYYLYLDESKSFLTGEIFFPEAKSDFKTILCLPVFSGKISINSNVIKIVDNSKLYFSSCSGKIKFQVDILP